MARVKRSVSLPEELAQQIDAAAADEGTTMSGWLAQSAAHRLRIEAGRRALTDWEADNGALSDQERAEGLAAALASLGLDSSERRSA